MSLTTEFQSILDEYRQDAAAIEGRKMFKNLYHEVVAVNTQAQAIKDSGNFDLIPPSIKAALNKWWNLYKTTQADIEADPDLVELINLNI